MMHVERITLIAKLIFKTSMLRSSLCDYSDTYILVKGAKTVTWITALSPANNAGKEAVFKTCALAA